MKHLLTTFLCVFISTQIMAQVPDWSVNENNFEHTMTFLSFITIDGNRLENTNDKVAVFVNNDCRGVTNLTYVESQNKYYAFLTAFANVANETLTVKVYDSQNDEVKTIDSTINFEINEHQGTLFQAVSWAEPALNSEAEILEFGFEGISILQQTILDRDITLVIEDVFDLSALTPIFEISDNATLFKDFITQTSGGNILDFSNIITYQVRSQDQSLLSTWTITVIQTSNDFVYYKRDEVCYKKGAIKVVSSQNGQQVLLFQDEIQLDTQTLTNDEVLFEELEEGTYVVQIGNLTKEITINLQTN